MCTPIMDQIDIIIEKKLLEKIKHLSYVKLGV